MAQVRPPAGPRWGAVALMALLSLCAPASAFAQDPPGLVFVREGEGPVPVSMAKNYYGEFSGRLNLAIRNDSEVTGRLRLLFVPANAGRAVNLGRENEGEFVRRVRPPAERLRLRPGDLRYVRLALRVPSRASLSSIDGMLVAQLRPSDKGAPGVPSTELRIVGKPRQTKDVAFEPTKVAIAVSRFCDLPTLATCHTSAEVTLRGDGAHRLLVNNRDPDARGILHSSSGDTVSASLGDLAEDENGVITGQVKLSDIEHAGKYEGVLAVTPGGEGAAQVPLTVRVGNSFFWAFLAVLVGAGLAYIIRWREQIGQQRRRLQSHLTGAIRRYEKVLREGGSAPPASFDLTPELGPPPWHKPLPEPDGIAGLRHDIQQAQAGEFADVTERVDAMVLRISRWVDVERAVRHAQERLGQPVPPLDEHEIADSRSAGKVDALIDQASSESVLEDCKQYLDDLRRHLRLYERLREVWQLKVAILRNEHLGAEKRSKLAEIDVWGADGSLEENPEDLEKVHSALRDVERRLRKISGVGPAREPGPRHPVPYTRGWESDLTTRLRKERRWREFFLRWRTRSAWLNWHDFFWAFVAIAIASIGYAVTFYDDTWGSKVDFFTAIAAGFGVKFGADAAQKFDWSTVPVVGSFMSTVTGTGETPAGPESGDDGRAGRGGDQSKNGGGGGGDHPSGEEAERAARAATR